MNAVYQNALGWLEQGYPVIPITRGTKAAAVKWRDYRHRLPRKGDLALWFLSGRYAAYGLLLGRFGLTVLDFDDLALYFDWRTWAAGANVTANCIAETGYTVMTGRGAHVYVRALESVQTRKFDGFDLKAANGYVLGEASQHPSGATYTRLDNAALILPVERIADVLPPWLNEKIPAFVLSSPTRLRTQYPPSREDGDALARAQNVLTWEEAKRRAKLVPAWEVLGVTPVPSGPGKGMARCPLHDDQHPSLSCDLLTGRVSCLAGCTGPHGWDATDAYRWRNGCDFVTAVKRLAEGR